MSSLLSRFRRLVFGVNPRRIARPLEGVSFVSETARVELEGVVHSFLEGYHIAVDERDVERIGSRLDELEPGRRGFAYEGAGMAIQLIDDFVLPGGRRLAEFLAGPGRAHCYMVHVGVGWAFARRGASLERRVPALDQLLGRLAVDGFGFYEGFFHSERFHRRRELPKLADSMRSTFDQGLGRSLWFMDGADPERVIASTQAFNAERRPDVVSGVGLACAYAGGAPRGAARRIVDAFPDYAAHFAQGVAFAAAAREQAGNPGANTEAACQAVWGMSAEALLDLAEDARRSVTAAGVHAESYEQWRAAVRALFESKGVTRVRPA